MPSVSAPSQVAHLRELEASGKARGWFKRVRNIRDYMNHRDKRGYLDPGREELSDEAIAWMHDLRRAFSELLLAAMGIPLPRWELSGVKDTAPRNSTIREIATSAVDDLFIGTVSAMHVGAEDGPDATTAITGHFGRAFTAAACGSPQLWSESLTALIRRSVVAWSRLGEDPELRQLVEDIELDHNGQTFLMAITTAPADEAELPLAELSRLAVHRATAWFRPQRVPYGEPRLPALPELVADLRGSAVAGASRAGVALRARDPSRITASIPSSAPPAAGWSFGFVGCAT